MSLIRSLIRVGVAFEVLTSAAVLLVKHLMKRNSHTHRSHDAAKRSENSKQETSISKYEADTGARERSNEKHQAREEKYWIFSIIISLGALGGAAYGVVVAKDALTASQQQASAALGQLVETRAQERAWIGILGVVIAKVPVVGSELKIVFDYQNYGHAPARDLTITRDVRNFSGMRPSDITPSFTLSDIEA